MIGDTNNVVCTLRPYLWNSAGTGTSSLRCGHIPTSNLQDTLTTYHVASGLMLERNFRSNEAQVK